MSLPTVSSEGGPLLVADYESLRPWKGAFDDSGDYERACGALGTNTVAEIEAGSNPVLVWDMGGPGTACVVRVSPQHVSIVRVWPDAAWTDEDYDRAVASAATECFGVEELARLTIHSGYLLALWGPEDMTLAGSPSGDSGVPDDLSVGDGGGYVRVPTGCYFVTACEWQEGNYDVTKIDLKLQA